MSTRTYKDNEQVAIAKLFVGRRIIAAIVGAESESGSLVLDDGTQIEVLGNQGCGGCSAGWYTIEKLATVDNAISNVEVIDDGNTYRIHVVADSSDMDVLVVTGFDNGYYGSGYTLTVTLRNN